MSVTWNAGGGDIIRTQVCNPIGTRFPPLHLRMIILLRDVSFDGVVMLTDIHIYWSFVTALVER